ncbi:beach domain-containing protein lvsc [Anaeramoeba flamelloides]|uniref:Beach domain-containing protein lvsc n=1 Tax=Anaeramoeba flamelloides TaxID=1746091 RepID=A0AAV8AJC5_9EUKA|nr:beach domain-containing protein lvsc [Anaeramoeba flamelloides]
MKQNKKESRQYWYYEFSNLFLENYSNWKPSSSQQNETLEESIKRNNSHNPRIIFETLEMMKHLMIIIEERRRKRRKYWKEQEQEKEKEQQKQKQKENQKQKQTKKTKPEKVKKEGIKIQFQKRSNFKKISSFSILAFIDVFNLLVRSKKNLIYIIKNHIKTYLNKLCLQISLYYAELLKDISTDYVVIKNNETIKLAITHDLIMLEFLILKLMDLITNFYKGAIELEDELKKKSFTKLIFMTEFIKIILTIKNFGKNFKLNVIQYQIIQKILNLIMFFLNHNPNNTRLLKSIKLLASILKIPYHPKTDISFLKENQKINLTNFNKIIKSTGKIHNTKNTNDEDQNEDQEKDDPINIYFLLRNFQYFDEKKESKRNQNITFQEITTFLNKKFQIATNVHEKEFDITKLILNIFLKSIKKNYLFEKSLIKKLNSGKFVDLLLWYSNRSCIIFNKIEIENNKKGKRNEKKNEIQNIFKTQIPLTRFYYKNKKKKLEKPNIHIEVNNSFSKLVQLIEILENLCIESENNLKLELTENLKNEIEKNNKGIENNNKEIKKNNKEIKINNKEIKKNNNGKRKTNVNKVGGGINQGNQGNQESMKNNKKDQRNINKMHSFQNKILLNFINVFIKRYRSNKKNNLINRNQLKKHIILQPFFLNFLFRFTNKNNIELFVKMNLSDILLTRYFLNYHEEKVDFKKIHKMVFSFIEYSTSFNEMANEIFINVLFRYILMNNENLKPLNKIIKLISKVMLNNSVITINSIIKCNGFDTIIFIINKLLKYKKRDLLNIKPKIFNNLFFNVFVILDFLLYSPIIMEKIINDKNLLNFFFNLFFDKRLKAFSLHHLINVIKKSNNNEKSTNNIHTNNEQMNLKNGNGNINKIKKMENYSSKKNIKSNNNNQDQNRNNSSVSSINLSNTSNNNHSDNSGSNGNNSRTITNLDLNTIITKNKGGNKEQMNSKLLHKLINFIQELYLLLINKNANNKMQIQINCNYYNKKSLININFYSKKYLINLINELLKNISLIINSLPALKRNFLNLGIINIYQIVLNKQKFVLEFIPNLLKILSNLFQNNPNNCIKFEQEFGVINFSKKLSKIHNNIQNPNEKENLSKKHFQLLLNLLIDFGQFNINDNCIIQNPTIIPMIFIYSFKISNNLFVDCLNIFLIIVKKSLHNLSCCCVCELISYLCNLTLKIHKKKGNNLNNKYISNHNDNDNNNDDDDHIINNKNDNNNGKKTNNKNKNKNNNKMKIIKIKNETDNENENKKEKEKERESKNKKVNKNQNELITNRVFKLIKIIGSYSISVKELKILFNLLKFLSTNHIFNSQLNLIKSIREILKHQINLNKQKIYKIDPKFFFGFDGIKSNLEITKLENFPNKNGYSFTSWIRIISLTHPTNKPFYLPRLYCFLNENGFGFEVYFKNHSSYFEENSDQEKEKKYFLVLRIIKNRLKPKEIETKLTIPFQKWFFLTITHSPKMISIYINNKEILHQSNFEYPPVDLPYIKNKIGSNFQNYSGIDVFWGQISTINFFNSYLTVKQINELWELGPNYYGVFDDSSKIQSPTSLLLNELSKVIFLSYNAKAVRNRIAINQAPFINNPNTLKKNKVNNKKKQNTNAKLISMFKFVSIEFYNIIQCLGGIKIFFPLILQLNHQQNKKITINIGNNNNNNNNNKDDDILFEIIGLIFDFLIISKQHQKDFLSINGFQLITYLFQNISTMHLNLKILDYLSSTIMKINNEKLIKIFINDFLLKFNIWINYNLEIQVLIIRYLTELYNKNYFTISNILEIIQKYYWIIPTSNSKFKKTDNINDNDNENENENDNNNQLGSKNNGGGESINQNKNGDNANNIENKGNLKNLRIQLFQIIELLILNQPKELKPNLITFLDFSLIEFSNYKNIKDIFKFIQKILINPKMFKLFNLTTLLIYFVHWFEKINRNPKIEKYNHSNLLIGTLKTLIYTLSTLQINPKKTEKCYLLIEHLFEKYSVIQKNLFWQLIKYSIQKKRKFNQFNLRIKLKLFTQDILINKLNKLNNTISNINNEGNKNNENNNNNNNDDDDDDDDNDKNIKYKNTKSINNISNSDNNNNLKFIFKPNFLNIILKLILNFQKDKQLLVEKILNIILNLINLNNKNLIIFYKKKLIGIHYYY